MTAAVCVVLLLVMLAIRVPKGIALSMVSIGGIIALRGTRPAFGVLGSLPFDFAASWSLSAVPMFLLMGSLASHTGLTRSLYHAARLWFNGLPGGLAVASNFASAGFAAASGSSLATAAAMGRFAIPEWREKLTALKDIWPMPLLIICVVGGIFSGITTATEAGAFGASFALLIAFFMGRLSRTALVDSFMEALRTTASIFFIAIGAILFTRFLAMAGVPQMMGDIVETWNLGILGVVLVMIVVYLILGMFLDPIGIILLTLPVFLPMFEELEVNLIWIGVLVVKMIEVGLLTPPVGMNAFVVKNIVGDQVPRADLVPGLRGGDRGC